MANWSVKATAAALDTANNNGNVIITFVATNSVTSETVAEQIADGNWTVVKAQACAQRIIDRLLARDAAKAIGASVLPGIQTYIAQNNILASG